MGAPTATALAEQVRDSRATGPWEIYIAGAGYEHLSATGYQLVEVRKLP